eukprot:6085843-Amphidinium_carterae.2
MHPCMPENLVLLAVLVGARKCVRPVMKGNTFMLPPQNNLEFYYLFSSAILFPMDVRSRVSSKQHQSQLWLSAKTCSWMARAHLALRGCLRIGRKLSTSDYSSLIRIQSYSNN